MSAEIAHLWGFFLHIFMQIIKEWKNTGFLIIIKIYGRISKFNIIYLLSLTLFII